MKIDYIEREKNAHLITNVLAHDRIVEPYVRRSAVATSCIFLFTRDALFKPAEIRLSYIFFIIIMIDNLYIIRCN